VIEGKKGYFIGGALPNSPQIFPSLGQNDETGCGESVKSMTIVKKGIGVWENLVRLVNGGIISLLMKGGIIMIPLLVSSVISLTVILERLCFWRRVQTQAVHTTILALVTEGDLGAAYRVASRSHHPVARVLLAGLEHKDRSPNTAMEAAAQAEVGLLRRNLPILDTIITLAPLLGLLGTITGMISAFGIMSEAGLGQPHAVTGGVAEALIATAFGLFVAIMTLVPYNYLNAKAEQLTSLIEEQATRLELLLGSQKE
jgi:biopolymer transport protein ExbB